MTRLCALSDYERERTVLPADKKAWACIRKWQQSGLVSVQPIERGIGCVVLTEKGRALIGSEPHHER